MSETTTTTATAKAKSTSSTGTPAATTPATAAKLPPIPRLEDHPAYREAAANLARVVARAEGLEWERSNRAEAATKLRDLREDAALALVAGKTPPRPGSADAEYARVSADLRVAQRAVQIAKDQLSAAAAVARKEFAEKVGPRYREVMRAAVLAMIESCRAYAKAEDLQEQLFDAGLMDSLPQPIPRRHPWGRCDDPVSAVNLFVGSMIDYGMFDVKADAAVLAGLKPQIAPPPVPPVPPPPAKKSKTWSEAFASLGIAGFSRNGPTRTGPSFTE